MVMVLKNKDMEDLPDMKAIIDAVEIAFRDLGKGVSVNLPRARIRILNEETGLTYFFNNLAGAVPHFKAMALRIDSVFSRDVVVDGMNRREYPGDFTGLVFLFSMENCHLLAVMDDHYISKMRVGATTGVATKYMARDDAKTLGLFGSGEQARTSLMAIAAVRNLEKVKVYSPNPEHRSKFSAEMSERLALDIEPVDNPRDVVKGADIVSAATNTIDPVVMGKWLEEGMHINSIVGGDIFQKRMELDDEAVGRSDVIIVTSKEQIFRDKQAEIYDRIEKGIIKKEDLHELGELLTGKASGRTNPRQITFFKNNTGMGIQFTAAAYVIYELAKEKGLGKELDPELFITRKGEDETYSP